MLYITNKNKHKLNKIGDRFGESIYIKLKEIEGVKLPKMIRGSLYLNEVDTIKGINLPEIIKESLFMRGIELREFLKLDLSKYLIYYNVYLKDGIFKLEELDELK